MINYAVTDMVLNYICPGFALGSNTLLIEGTNELMIDNIIVKERLVTNEKLKELKDEYKRLLILTQDLTGIEKYREGLRGEIDNLIKDAILTGVSLCKIDEMWVTLLVLSLELLKKVVWFPFNTINF